MGLLIVVVLLAGGLFFLHYMEKRFAARDDQPDRPWQSEESRPKDGAEPGISDRERAASRQASPAAGTAEGFDLPDQPATLPKDPALQENGQVPTVGNQDYPFSQTPSDTPPERLNSIESAIQSIEGALAVLKTEVAALKDTREQTCPAGNRQAVLDEQVVRYEAAFPARAASRTNLPDAHVPSGPEELCPASTEEKTASLAPEKEGRPEPLPEIGVSVKDVSGDGASSRVEKTGDHTFSGKIPPTAGQPRTAPEQETLPERLWYALSRLGITRLVAASNIWVLAGIAVLLVGLVFLVRFAIEHGILVPEARLAISALVGLTLLFIGWRHRNTKRELGLILQGGGVGAMYLTIVAAVRLYDLIPSGLAFGLLVGVVAFSTIISVSQNSRIMAHVSYAAGFLAPVLVSTDSGNYIVLFSYYILLNLGIVAVSRFRLWRSLHLTGFAFTALIGGLWGAGRYHPDLFLSVEPFLVAFFLIFTYLAVAGSKPASFARSSRKDIFIDAPLTLGTPVVFFLYQSAICGHLDLALAFSSLALGALYLFLAWRMWLTRNRVAPEAEWLLHTSGVVPPDEHADGPALEGLIRRGRSVQAEIYLAFGLIFANLAVPLALYDLGLLNLAERLMSLLWALEGASLVWLGRRNAMRIFQACGLVSLGVSFVFILKYASHGFPEYGSWASSEMAHGFGTYPALILGLLLHAISAGAFLAAALAVRSYPWVDENRDIRKAQEGILIGMAAYWLFGMSWFELHTQTYTWEILLLICVIAGAVCAKIADRWKWPALGYARLAAYAPFLVLLLPQVILQSGRFLIDDFGHLSGGGVSLGALLGFVCYEAFTLRRDGLLPGRWRTFRIGTVTNLFPLVLMAGLVYLAHRYTGLSSTWLTSLSVLVPALWLLLRSAGLSERYGLAGGGLEATVAPVLYCSSWFILHLFSLGSPAPLLYLPLFNPLEAALAASGVALWKHVEEAKLLYRENTVMSVIGRQAFWVAVCFLFANVAVARACALWTGMPFTLSGVFGNGTCQGAMAVLWALAGLWAMLHGHKTLQRSMWITGVFLIMADVIKLFAIDLTRMETLWRIIAFMVVGVLLIIIGYKVPLPPSGRRKARLAGEADGDRTCSAEGDPR